MMIRMRGTWVVRVMLRLDSCVSEPLLTEGDAVLSVEVVPLPR